MILKINPLRIINNYNNNTNTNAPQRNAYFPATKPMPYDSVSFTSKSKLMGSRADAVNHQLAQQIYAEAEPVMKEFYAKLTRYFGSLLADETHPDRPLAYKKGLTVRIKTPASICEKTASLRLKNKSEIKEELGDIIGARLVLRDAAHSDSVLKKLIDGVKNNDIKIFEIENYRPEAKYAYFSKKQLDSLEKVCSKMRTNGVTRTETSIPSGYTAVHFSVYLNDGFKGEIQLMGIDVERVKEIEDMLYKLKNNKSLAPKYKIIEEQLKELKTNKPLQRAVTAHSKEQYIAARAREPYGIKTKKNTKFLPAPAYIPPEYDFNRLYKLKMSCE